MICRIYDNGSYDEGTGDELEARRAGRLLVQEIEVRDLAADLPAEWVAAKQAHNTPKTELIEALGDAGERARLGELAANAKGTPDELAVLLAIREQLDQRISELE